MKALLPPALCPTSITLPLLQVFGPLHGRCAEDDLLEVESWSSRLRPVFYTTQDGWHMKERSERESHTGNASEHTPVLEIVAACQNQTLSTNVASNL